MLNQMPMELKVNTRYPINLTPCERAAEDRADRRYKVTLIVLAHVFVATAAATAWNVAELIRLLVQS